MIFPMMKLLTTDLKKNPSLAAHLRGEGMNRGGNLKRFSPRLRPRK